VLAYKTVQHLQGRDLDSRRLGETLLVDAIAAGEMIRRNDELLLHCKLRILQSRRSFPPTTLCRLWPQCQRTILLSLEFTTSRSTSTSNKASLGATRCLHR
jgi:hypothetical protein